MKTLETDSIAQNKNSIRIVLGTALLLLMPLIAMQFTHKVNWSIIDFVTAGVLLLGTSLLYELGTGKIRSTAYRAFARIALIAALMHIWIELAVGIFD